MTHLDGKDTWQEGYEAGLDGKTYDDNPYCSSQEGTPWAFGCSEGMKKRNSVTLKDILDMLREDKK